MDWHASRRARSSSDEADEGDGGGARRFIVAVRTDVVRRERAACGYGRGGGVERGVDAERGLMRAGRSKQCSLESVGCL